MALEEAQGVRYGRDVICAEVAAVADMGQQNWQLQAKLEHSHPRQDTLLVEAELQDALLSNGKVMHDEDI